MEKWATFYFYYKWLSFAVAIPMLGCLIWRYVQSVKRRPQLNKSDIVFQEWTASGCSQLNFITKMGGGRNCVRIVVTKEILWVTSWFPFSLFAPFYDMEHVIPLRSIVSLTHSSRFWSDSLILSYSDKNGRNHELRLFPRRLNEFLRSLGQPDISVAGESITSEKNKPLSFYLKAHAKYILPAWVFPMYFLIWGCLCQLIVKNDNYTVVLFFIFVAPPFFAVGIWARRVRNRIPYFKFCILTLVIPFLIFLGATIVFGLGQIIVKGVTGQ